MSPINRDFQINTEELSFDEVYNLAITNPTSLCFALYILHDIPQDLSLIITHVLKMSGGDQEWFYSSLDCCAISVGINSF